MAIFAPKCDRCGQRTRNKEDGQPICEACEQEMQLILNAAEENTHACPLDGSPMKKEVAHMIVIDKCPKCKGVWLDGGELEKLTGDLRAEAISVMTHSLSMTMP
ncbi:MAG: zf-TFIIB domain-containing protein [Halioglobus sp.]